MSEGSSRFGAPREAPLPPFRLGGSGESNEAGSSPAGVQAAAQAPAGRVDPMAKSAPGGAWEPPDTVHGGANGVPGFGQPAGSGGLSTAATGADPAPPWGGSDPGWAYVAAPLQSGWEPVGSFASPAGGGGGGGGWGPGRAGRSSRSRVPFMVVLLVLAVVAAVAAPFFLNRTTPSSAVDTAFVSTFVDNTVQTTFTFTVAEATKTAKLSGSAKTDEADKKLALTLTATTGATTVTIHLIADGTAIYVSAPGVLNLPTGKPWVGVTVGKLSSELPPGSATTVPVPNISLPGSPLAALQQAGATVVTEGTSSDGGVTVQGYKITLDLTAVISLLTSYGLPASDADSLRSSGLAPIVMTVDVDGTNQVRLLSGTTSDTSNGQTASVTATAQFSGYGQPVTVTPPPATQTATFLQVVGPLSRVAGGRATAVRLC